MLQASRRLPSCESMWHVAVRDQHFWPARRQSDSVERAEERRREISRRRERSVSVSVCLRVKLEVTSRSKADAYEPYLPTSNAGDAMGDSSVTTANMPSNFRSGKGAVTEAEMRVRTLHSCQCIL